MCFAALITKAPFTIREGGWGIGSLLLGVALAHRHPHQRTAPFAACSAQVRRHAAHGEDAPYKRPMETRSRQRRRGISRPKSVNRLNQDNTGRAPQHYILTLS